MAAKASKVLTGVVSDHVVAHARRAGETFTGYLRPVVANNPFKTAQAILSRADVDKVLTGALAASQSAVTDEIAAGWQAGLILGTQEARAELKALGLDLPADWQPHAGTAYLTSVLGDVAQAASDARSDIHHEVAQVFSSITQAPEGVPNSAFAIGQMRSAAIPDAVDRAVRRMTARHRASAVVVVPRAANEARLQAYLAVREAHPELTVGVRWETTSGHPCATCAALDGTVVPLGTEFDHTATTSEHLLPPRVYGDLTAPPRHPNCQCRLVLVVSVVPEALATELERPLAPDESDSMTAEEVRDMPQGVFDQMVGFIWSVVGTVRKLLGKPQNGPGKHRK